MLQTLTLASLSLTMASAMVVQPPALLPLGLKLRSASGAQDFCFPPFSTVTVRIPAGGNMGPGNSSVIMTEQVWTAPDAIRFNPNYSARPFGGGTLPPGFSSPPSLNVLQNFTSQLQWMWYNYEGRDTCSKQQLSQAAGALCIGADLSLNSTRIVGGRPVCAYSLAPPIRLHLVPRLPSSPPHHPTQTLSFPTDSWVGYTPASGFNDACWHELLIGSYESSDPAAWLSATSQCVATAGRAWPEYSIQQIAFSDFSDAPFAPEVFALPSYCEQ